MSLSSRSAPEMDQATNQWGGPLPYDPTEGTPIPVMVVDDKTAIGVMPVAQLLTLVLDPRETEDPKRIAVDPRIAAVGELRKEVQRMVEGAKMRNARKYGEYLAAGLRGERPWIAPPITLYHREALKVIRTGGGASVALLPFGDSLVSIDGETQRIGWQIAATQVPAALSRMVPIVLHHGKAIEDARQGFYDLNTREVKPNAAVAIAMDTQDPATRVTRRVIETASVLIDADGRSLIHLRRRQLRRSDPELLTISALRTGVVTTMLGVSGLQVGSRPVTLPTEVDFPVLREAVVEVWGAILDQLEDVLQRDQREQSVVSAPAILAGIGAVAHHAMPTPSRDEDLPILSVEEVLDRLEGVNWSRGNSETLWSPWDAIAGKFTPSGRFAIGGPKEVGYAVYNALRDPDSEAGKRVRTRG